MTLRIQVLGRMRAWRHDEPVPLGPPAQRAVLGLLVLAGGQPVGLPALVDGIWGEAPPASAVNVIQTHVKRLRRLLEPGRAPRTRSELLPYAGDGYRLGVTEEQVDLLRFRRLARQAGDEALAEALALWQGRPFADVPALAGHPKVLAVVAEYLAALTRYGQAMLAAGAVDRAVAAFEEVVTADPLDEAGQAEDPPAAAAPAAVPAELPADVPGFTDRLRELAELDRLTAAGVAVVSGTAGVGKTALATRWAHGARDRFPDGQLYVDLRGYDPEQPVAPGDALARFLRSLGLPGEQVPADTDERAARYRSLLSGRRMVILLDNAASVDQVRPLLPGSAGGAVLVTSRDALSGLVVRDGAGRLDLDVLRGEDALALLRRLVGDRVAADAPAARALVAHCAGLPLALRIAAELVHRRAPAGLAAVVGELADHRARLGLLSTGDPHSDIGAVFSWSYRDLPAAAARTFRLLGLHPGVDLDGYAAAALTGGDPAATRDSLALLARSNLVRGDDGRYAMHDLLRDYARELAARDGETGLPRPVLDFYLFTAAEAVNLLYPAERDRRPRVPPPPSPVPPLREATALAWLDAERSNLVATAVYAAAHGHAWYTVRLTLVLLRYLESGGYHADAVTLHEHALRAAQGDGASVAQLRNNLGVVHVQQGRYGQAGTELRRAIEAAQEAGDTPVIVRALGNLGHVHQWQGRYPEAAEALTEVIAVCRRTGDRAVEARGLGNLGHVRLRQGRYAEAAVSLRASAAICRDIGDEVGEAYAMVYLGHVESALGRHAEAAGHHRRALDLFRGTTELAGEAYALDGLGGVDVRLGEHRRAADRLGEALALFRRIGERAGEARVSNSLGEAAASAGRTAEAREHHLSALRLAEEIGYRYERTRAETALVSLPSPDRLTATG
jgi:tetratricopeptide (TPR) repeat protein